MTRTSNDARVLVVDDEPTLADLYSVWLQERYDVRIAYSGTDALDRMADDVDVALIDRHIPDRSGDELLSIIRDRFPNCRVAMVSAVDPDFDVVELAFDDYLVKPVERDALLSTVETLLARRTDAPEVAHLRSLVARREALELAHPRSELDRTPAYQRLIRRIRTAKATLDENVPRVFDSESPDGAC